MKTREQKVSIKVDVEKSVLDNTDEPYFYRLGFEKEAEVLETEVENGIEAWFEGFEILSTERGAGSNQEGNDKQLVSARLYYNVLVDIS